MMKADLDDCLARVYTSLAQFEIAEQYAKAAYDARLPSKDRSESDNKNLANSLHTLGYLALGQGKHDQAESYLREAWQMRASGDDEPNPELAETTLYLAWVLDEVCKYDESEKLFLEVITFYNDDPDRLRELSIARLALAASYVGQGRNVDAGVQLTQVLKSTSRAPTITRTLGDETLFQGFVHFLQAMLLESWIPALAETNFKTCLAEVQGGLGAEHPVVAIILCEMATVCEKQKKHDQAEQHYERSCRIVRKTVGLKHPRASILVGWYGQFLEDHEKLDQAAELYEELCQARRGYYRPDHPLTADSLVLKAMFLQSSRRDQEQAVRLYREAAGIYSKNQLNRSVYRSICFSRLGWQLLKNRRHEEALPYLKEACSLELKRKADDPRTLIDDLNVMYEAFSGSDKARHVGPVLEIFRRALPVIERLPPNSGPRKELIRKYDELRRLTPKDGVSRSQF
jgi:tetratricopeptide (TPR) repeat protein